MRWFQMHATDVLGSVHDYYVWYVLDDGHIDLQEARTYMWETCDEGWNGAEY